MNSIIQFIKKHKIKTAIAFVILLVVLGFKIKNRNQSAGSVTEPLSKGSIVESVYGIGTITANKSYQLKMGVTTTVLKTHVKEGDQVKKGQKIIDLEASSFKAPFDGTVTFIPAKEGETVLSNSVVFSVVDLLDRYAVVSLEQQGALRVKQGQKVRLNFDSVRDETYHGTVEAVYSNDNSFLVRISISHLPPQILPGMTADVAIGISEHKDVLLVPVAAIDTGGVTVVNSYGRNTKVPIKTGIVDGAMAEVISGDIKEGDLLLIKKRTGL